MKFIPLLALLLLTGCTTVAERKAVTDPAATWQSRQQSLRNLEHWQLKGRIAIINGVEAWHLNVNWQQKQADYFIQLSGPFGSGQVQLRGNEQGVILTDTEQQVFVASEAETLLYDHTGVRMPVNGLRYWILGLPGPASNSRTELDAYGRLAELQQNDWNIILRRYTTLGNLELPDKLSVSKQDLKVRLVVDSWELGEKD